MVFFCMHIRKNSSDAPFAILHFMLHRRIAAGLLMIGRSAHSLAQVFAHASMVYPCARLWLNYCTKKFKNLLKYVQKCFTIQSSGRKWRIVVENGVKVADLIGKRVSSLLTGEFNHSIDAKGRLIIPSKFREILGEDFVITKGLDGCLFLYPNNEWKIFEEKLRTLPLTNKNARTFTRFFLGSAVDGGLDKQGRVLISSALRTFAGLEKDVVLVGVLDRVEIWDKAKWDENNAVVEADMDDIAGQMEELGLRI